MTQTYREFLESKITLQTRTGFQVRDDELNPDNFPHQNAAIKWAAGLGRALIAMSFGLGKTRIQCELARIIHARTGKKFLVICPLGVKYQFSEEDGPMLEMEWKYVTNDADIEASQTPYVITNYERVRDGDITPSLHDFAGASLDEGSVLRSLGSKTYQVFQDLLKDIPYRFVATATPAPNEYKEIIHYAEFLGVMDRGQALTRWFKRDPQKAGHLTIHPIHEKDFWMWVASWALFLFTPSDLGFSDEGYDLPPLQVHWHRISVDHTRAWEQTDNRGQHRLLLDAAGGVREAVAEKRATMDDRIHKMTEIIFKQNVKLPKLTWLIWHHLEDERHAIERAIPAAVSVYGNQDLELREQRIMNFAHGQIRILATKPEIAGSGCNFQHHCSANVFLGVDYKFQDFIQAIHRTYRFQQRQPVDVHIIYAESEDQVVETLKKKWQQHDKLVERMRQIVRKYNLSVAAMQADLTRSIGVERIEHKGKLFTAVNNDCILEMEAIPDNYAGLIHTSIPFGNHYEYTAQVEDFGHNPTDDDFWVQMDFLIPQLLRILKPGRLAAIHVKDRVLYGHQTPTGFLEIEPFSDECAMAFRKHGFLYEGRRTIVTDVVRENASTYRLGWSEMSKDASKMGCGLPEYLLLFRKPPTDAIDQRADEPVTKDKETYTRARWQVDAHSLWRSNGDGPLTPVELYDYEAHIERLEEKDRRDNLPASFFYEPPKSKNGWVWDDVVFMRTLNTEQSRKRLENHICLARDSMVLTKGGYKPIQDVQVGDLVLTHMGRWRPVQVVKNMGIRPVVTLKAHGVPGLTLTPDHELWTRPVRNLPWSRCHSRLEATRATPQWVPAHATAGSYVNLKLPPIEPCIGSELDWWIVGRWIADGHWDQRGSAILSAGRHEVVGLVERLGAHAGGVMDTGSAVQIRIKDRQGVIRTILERCGNHAGNKHFPAEAYCLPNHLASSLLAGYLSGDGHYEPRRGRWMATTVSRELALGLAMLVQRVHGEIASVYSGRKGGPSIILGRDVTTLPEWVVTFQTRKVRKTRKPMLLDDGAWKRVSKVEAAGEAETWCLRVAEDESFTADGCIVKNCPLPFDIVERAIRLYSNIGDVVLDPFSGLGTVVMKAIEFSRIGHGIELNSEYYQASLKYCKAAEEKALMPSLFDYLRLMQAAQAGAHA